MCSAVTAIIGQLILAHLVAPSRKEWDHARNFTRISQVGRCTPLELIQSALDNKPVSKPKGTCKSEQKLRQAYVALNDDNVCLLRNHTPCISVLPFRNSIFKKGFNQ